MEALTSSVCLKRDQEERQRMGNCEPTWILLRQNKLIWKTQKECKNNSLHSSKQKCKERMYLTMWIENENECDQSRLQSDWKGNFQRRHFRVAQAPPSLASFRPRASWPGSAITVLAVHRDDPRSQDSQRVCHTFQFFDWLYRWSSPRKRMPV